MKYTSLLFSALTLLLFSACGTSAQGVASKDAPQELRVLSYNIHHANPPALKDSIDLEGIAKVIAAADPDLVALQEVDADTKRSGAGNQAELLGERLGMYVFFGKAIDFNGGEYGTAILSKYPLKETQVHQLPDNGGNAEPRVVTWGKMQLPNGPELLFGSTHLDHLGDPANRLLQIEELHRLSENSGLPVIIAGDLNAQPESAEMKLVSTYFKVGCQQCPFTFPADAPDRAIDYIILSDPSNIFEIGENKIPEMSRASDHLPVLNVYYY